MRLERDDLAGLVGAFPRAKPGRGLAELPSGAGNYGRCYHRADRALGWVSERRKRIRLDARATQLGNK